MYVSFSTLEKVVTRHIYCYYKQWYGVISFVCRQVNISSGSVIVCFVQGAVQGAVCTCVYCHRGQ